MSKIVVFCLIFCKYINLSLTDDTTTEHSFDITSNYYTAAVLEFNPPGDNFSIPKEIVDANLKEYIKWIYEAKEHNVDILAFPEATLNYHGLSGDDLREFAIPLPQEEADRENEYSCDYSSNAILNELSDAVGNASMYVLVNIVEIEICNETTSNAGNYALYNTNIVFNRYGCIISKYRKFNLFIEPHMSVPEVAELATFETDFGVTFGHFICFDILFKSPAYDLVLSNISHFIYPSMWYSEVPFLTSIQLQQSYAYQNDIVLLSSGANSPSHSSTGSGIYIGKYGAANSVISCRNETKIIVAKVPKNLDDDTFIPDNLTINPCTPIEMDSLKTWSFNPQHIYPLTENFHVQNGGIECEFTINFTKISIEDDSIGYTYKLAAFDGIRSYADIINAGEIYCAIVPCLDDDSHSCGHKFQHSEKLVPSVIFHSIKIVTRLNTKVDKDDYILMPTSLDFSLHPLTVDGFKFSSSSENDLQLYEVQSQSELNNLLTFGIYGRNFSADNKIFNKREIDALSTSTEFEESPYMENEIDDDSKTRRIKQIAEADDDYVAWKLTIYAALMVVLCIVAAILVYRRLQHPYEHPLIIMRRKSEMHAS